MKNQFDVAVVGGGPSGAIAAYELARRDFSVAMIDRPGRIKPCGGAIPPRLIRDFEIPTSLLCARISSARMISPSARRVDMPINGGYVGMVNRETFDEYLRERAVQAGVVRFDGKYTHTERHTDKRLTVFFDAIESNQERMAVPQANGGADPHPPRSTGCLDARLIIGADGARSRVAKEHLPDEKIPCVSAYHEIVEAPLHGTGDYEPGRCDVIYDGSISPDFYGWVFPHGATASIGTGTAKKGLSIKSAVRALRQDTGLTGVRTLRREGAPIPLKPRKRWDNGKDVLVIGDAAGVVAPASGEGIYYAMVSAVHAAEAAGRFLETSQARELKHARKSFLKSHGRVFWVLAVMQYFWYSSDKRRERFVSICRDKDVQELTWQAYMNKELVRAKPGAHLRIFFKDMAHLMGWVAP